MKKTPLPRKRRPHSGVGRSLATVIVAAMLTATVFTAARPVQLFSGDISTWLAEALIPPAPPQETAWVTPTPRPKPRIGIVVGHWGDNNDPGAVCPDGLTELSLNQEVAARVQQKLAETGFDVELLKEFDERLNGYRALLLLSIHADTCQFINNEATGFKLAASQASPNSNRTARLVACLRNRYARATGLSEHPGVSDDMTYYHTFSETDPDTPTVIIETGHMNLDRQVLTQNQAEIADGIVAGILCYIYNEDVQNAP